MSVTSSTSSRWPSNALLAALVWLFFLIGCEHSGEETWPTAVGNYDDVGSSDLVVPSLSFFIEDDPDDADAKGDSSDESSDHLAGNDDCDSWFVAFLVNYGYTGDPLPDSAAEDASRDDEVCEKDEDIDDGGLDAKDVEDTFTAAKDRSDDEHDHQQDSDVDCEGVGASQWPGEFKSEGRNSAWLS